MAKKRRTSKKTPEHKPSAPDRAPESSAPADPAASFARLHVWQVQAFRDILFVAIVIGVIWLGYALRAVTIPLLVALMLAYLFEPVVLRLCEHPKITRLRAVIGMLAIVIVGCIITLALIIPLAAGQTTAVVRSIQDGTAGEKLSSASRYIPSVYRTEVENLLESLPGYVPHIDKLPTGEEVAAPGDAGTEESADDEDPSVEPIVEPIVETIPAGPDPDDTLDAAADVPLTRDEIRALVREEMRQPTDETDWSTLARGGFNALFDVLRAIIAISLLAFLVPFYFFFFSLWYADVIQFLRKLLPERNREHTLELLDHMDRVVSGFVRGRIIISLIMGVMLAVGWMICGVPYAILLGMIIGILSLVPYLGGLGIPLAIVLILFAKIDADPKNVWWFLQVFFWPTAVFGIVQFVESYYLTPKIAGKATNLDPVTIVVAVLAGGSVLGVYGMLLAIPLTACLKILFIEVLYPRILAWTRGELADPLPIERE